MVQDRVEVRAASSMEGRKQNRDGRAIIASLEGMIRLVHWQTRVEAQPMHGTDLVRWGHLHTT
jgi:hypothetical protein